MIRQGSVFHAWHGQQFSELVIPALLGSVYDMFFSTKLCLIGSQPMFGVSCNSIPSSKPTSSYSLCLIFAFVFIFLSGFYKTHRYKLECAAWVHRTASNGPRYLEKRGPCHLISPCSYMQNIILVLI